MLQIELLDLVLKALYETPSRSGEIVKLLKQKGVEVTLDEAKTLGRRLGDLKYVAYTPTTDSAHVDLRSEGIEFVQGSSFTHKGHSIITNHYSISNSPNANLVSSSSHVQITQQNTTELKQVLDQMKEAITVDASVDPRQQQEIVERINEIQESVAAGRPPKFAIKSLVEIASTIGSVAKLATQLMTLLPI
ncbi:hypothetical protein HNV11_12525 [Spirosoma taeanense]|uniref:Uncharacterized protein n=1 Tax=Spirosoma taeanense TaxID=2735870 RepID=A0A6M5Y9H9_9BACT|nr:hypothetical protein [Spirosoma taeanense]QJW90144.1 hypothetical protein HNV11_12525 [Spirosoma taeanense]